MADTVDGSTVLSLYTPPESFRFARGLVVTHDLSMGTLSERLLPELAGVATTDRRRRLLDARTELQGTDLLVLAAADRIDWRGPAVPAGTKVVPVSGRRLHAKFGLLQFVSPTGVHRTRAFVTSANVTSGGTGGNHEFVVFDEVGRHQRHLAFDLVEAARALCRSPGLSDEGRKRLDRMLRQLRRGLPAGGQPTGMVVHSLDQQRDLTGKWAKGALARGPITELTIVSPGFAPEGSNLRIPGLEKVLAATASTRLVTSVDSDGRPLCSRSVQSKLGSGLRIEVPCPPGNPTDAPRRLHGKFLAASVGRGRLELLVGSANLTSRGLGGENRELMYAANISADQLDDLLTEIAPIEPSHEPVAPEVPDLPPEIEEGTSTVTATFRPTAGGRHHERRWAGTLSLQWEGETPLRLRHGDVEVDVVDEQPFLLNSDAAVLQVQYHPSGDESLVPIEIVDEPEGFWRRQRDPDDLPFDPFLRWLLADLRRAASKSEGDDVGPSGPSTSHSASTPDDRFAIPLEQRLVLLVRHRQRLDGEMAQPDVRRAVEQFLQQEGDAAVQVGLAAVEPGLHLDSPNPLIAAFASAVAALGEDTSES